MSSVCGYLWVPCFLCQSGKKLWLIDAIFVHGVGKTEFLSISLFILKTDVYSSLVDGQGFRLKELYLNDQRLIYTLNNLSPAQISNAVRCVTY